MSVEENKLHLDHRVTYGHIISTILLLGVVLGVYTDNISQHNLADKRISIIEAQMEANQDAAKDFREQLNKRLLSMGEKLDRLIERELNSKGSQR